MYNHLETIEKAINALHSRYRQDDYYRAVEYLQDLEELIALQALLEEKEP